MPSETQEKTVQDEVVDENSPSTFAQSNWNSQPLIYHEYCQRLAKSRDFTLNHAFIPH